MTKKVTIIIVFYFGITFCFGQHSKFVVGVNGGVSRSIIRKYQVVPEAKRKLKIGIIAGVAFTYNLSNAFAIKTGINYAQKGDDFANNHTIFIYSDGGSSIGSIENRITFNYLTMPVLFQYSIGGRLKFLINIGGYWGFLLKSTTYYKSELNSKTFESNNHHTYKYHRIDFGLAGGIGASYQIGKSFLLTIEIRENYGLMNINPGGQSVYGKYNSQMLNETTSIIVGVAYRF